MRKRIFVFYLAYIGSTFFLHAQSYINSASWKDFDGGITSMTVDGNRTQLICGDATGNIYFRELNSGKPINKIKAHGAAVNTLAFNSTGRLLISSTRDGEIKIYDFDKARIVQSIFSPDYSGINFVLFSIADGFIYFNGNNRLYKTRSDLTQQVNKILEEKDTLFDAVITTDRNSVIYTTGSALKVMDTRTDQIKQEMNTGSASIRYLALVSDSILATWSKDGTINFWSYRLGQILPAPLFWYKAGEPASMNFSTDGKIMVSGNIGNWVRVWHPFEKKISQELFGHKEKVNVSVFGTDTNTIFTGSLDGSLIAWKKQDDQNPVQQVIPITPQETPVTIEPVPELEKNTADVEMAEKNIPKYIRGRKVGLTETIEVNQPSIKIFIFDNSFLDGDSMSLFFNGEWILDHYGVTKEKKEITLNFYPNTNNFLVMFANNLGKQPPNTAAVQFNDGKKVHFFRLSSNLNTCSALNFVYRKKP